MVGGMEVRLFGSSGPYAAPKIHLYGLGLGNFGITVFSFFSYRFFGFVFGPFWFLVLFWGACLCNLAVQDGRHAALRCSKEVGRAAGKGLLRFTA